MLHELPFSFLGASDTFDESPIPTPAASEDHFSEESNDSVQQREDLAYQLLASLPRARLARLQRKLAPLLKFDVVGTLPNEVALLIFSHLSAETLMLCTQVCHRWKTLADEQCLWKPHCDSEGWEWRQPPRIPDFQPRLPLQPSEDTDDDDDEGMGDSDPEDGLAHHILNPVAFVQPLGVSSADGPESTDSNVSSSSRAAVKSMFPPKKHRPALLRHSAPSTLNPQTLLRAPDYRLLYRTHILLNQRFRSRTFRLSALQTKGAPTNTHAAAIYCLQLYTYPTGVQVLFTGSRDKTIREWNLNTGLVERVVKDIHQLSILSLCVAEGHLASGGTDNIVGLFDLENNQVVKTLRDHVDSVLCVRFDSKRLVSCSKDRTIRTYSFPDLTPELVLTAHRSAVNAVSLSGDLVVSASGDRSIRVWDACSGNCLQTFEGHSSRGIASIDFAPPFVLSGSSDKHLRFFDITSLQGWSTHPKAQYPPITSTLPSNHVEAPTANETLVCHACGSPNLAPAANAQQHSSTAVQEGNAHVNGRVKRCHHEDLVRSVVIGKKFVVSGSYDLSIKVWDRKTGRLVADLKGGHTSRIFCIAIDSTKIISCGEDQRICIWDFSFGIDTSFVKL
ncbi:WD40 repeat-like protein [Flagelloscypha sp. PMI_526]|nr:WD40 repeat-like protein [Flagelloscypha sp. PMI_526]